MNRMNLGQMIQLFRDFVSEDIDPEDKRETGVYWKSDRIIRLLNVGQDHCADKISRQNMSLFSKIYETESSSDGKFLLPEDFLRAVEVRANDSRIDPMDTSYGRKDWFAGGYYYFEGNFVVLPSGTSRLKLLYVRKPIVLKNLLDICEVPDPEYVVMYAVLSASEIDEAMTLTPSFSKRFDRVEQNALSSVADRQVQESRYVHPELINAGVV